MNNENTDKDFLELTFGGISSIKMTLKQVYDAAIMVAHSDYWLNRGPRVSLNSDTDISIIEELGYEYILDDSERMRRYYNEVYRAKYNQLFLENGDAKNIKKKKWVK